MKKEKLTDLERLAVRQRPEGQPIMHQVWAKLLFMHWRIDEKQLRPLIPQQLSIDTFDGSAWIAITPFTIPTMRALPPFMPALPGISSMHELNVRTYVYLDGVPGVWFFSLDASSSLAVMAARMLYHLPYLNADINLDQQDATIDYSLRRTDSPPAELDASWTIGGNPHYAHPGTLEFFLVERYCLYAENNGQLYRARIYHEPWPLQKAELNLLSSTMIESHGLKTRGGDPLLHYAEEIDVDIWPIAKAE
ncbi:MAG TPA: DUF2071 domain-containing protein [Pyrinomonadaceae bacterium]|jgi:hypothetical protein